MLLLNIGAVVTLLLCALAPYTDPVTTKYIALFGLGTPYVIAVNVLFFFFWLIFAHKKWKALISFVPLLLCYKLILICFGTNLFKKSDWADSPRHLKLMTWNGHGVGVFNNPVNKEFNDRILRFLDEQDADILCIPEFSLPKTDIITPYTKQILANSGYKDYRFQADNTLGTTIFLGTAVFSKYPLFHFKANKLAEYIYLLQADVELPGNDTMRMFFVHLNTFGLSDDDKANIEELKSPQGDIKAEIQRSRSFLWKFNYAFARRAREVNAAKAIISQSPYPMLICGDFNDLPGSYTYATLSEGLQDAFLDMGVGLGRTYNQIAPNLRIDHVFYDPSILRCRGYKSPYTSLSDHNPVIVNFEILNAPQG